MIRVETTIASVLPGQHKVLEIAHAKCKDRTLDERSLTGSPILAKGAEDTNSKHRPAYCQFHTNGAERVPRPA